MTTENICKRASECKTALGTAGTDTKNRALEAIADALENNKDKIISENKKDLADAVKDGMSDSMLDRLTLTEQRIKGMADGARKLITLPDPVGRILSEFRHENGMTVEKITTPIGVIGIIFEARPNVTADAACLCLKSGNVCVLRGGREAVRSNTAVMDVMRAAVVSTGLPADCMQLITDTSHESANVLMTCNKYVDVLIPRGGKKLIRATVENATVPVIETGAGNCSIYVEKTADINTAADIIFNAKTSRPSVCNAAESLLIDKDIAKKALPVIYDRLAAKNVTVYGDEQTCEILADAVPQTEEDRYAEYNDYKMSCNVVSGIDEAIRDIEKYGTHHSDCIVTTDDACAEKFLAQVDSAAVYVNASTRFTDGGEFGFGAEIGISTQKLHARGPLGLPELTTFKYIIRGNGQVR
jgi:glutamate-5-semialdehyde dehydrogenase